MTDIICSKHTLNHNMDAHTIENIRTITDSSAFLFHETSIVYIQSLVLPYVQVLEHATFEEILQWIPIALPEVFSKHLIEELGKEVRLIKSDDQGQKFTDEQSLGGKKCHH
jgi:hypothetical protein